MLASITTKRPDDSSLNYLYRLNVIALTAELKIKKELFVLQKELMKQYIRLLKDPEFANL